MTFLYAEADAFVKRLVVITLLLALASSILAAVAPVFLKAAIDALELTRSYTAYGPPVYLIGAFALCHWLSRSMKELRAVFLGRTDQRIQRQVSYKLFRHVISLPLLFHLERQTGAISQTLANGLAGYRMLLHHFMLTVLPVVIELSTMGAVLLVLDQGLFVGVIAVSLSLYACVFWLGVSRIRAPTRAVSAAHIDANAMLTDSLLNFETVKYFGAEAQVHGRLHLALAKTEAEWKRLHRRKLENGLLVAAIFGLSLTASVYLAARKVQQGHMSIGEFVLVNTYLLQITQPLEMIGFAFRDIAEGISFIEKMMALLNQRREEDIAGQAILPTGGQTLDIENVSLVYDIRRPVLRHVTFSIPAGKTVAVVGKSGCGKSSLIRLLFRLMEPSEGTIYLNGVPLAEIPISTLRAAIAVVPQDIVLFNESIAFNIALGKQNSTDFEIVEAAKIAAIHDFVVRLPDGYATIVGERGLKLSGGEKQRIAIARAVMKRPKIFIFDEPTSSLDSNTEQAILQAMLTTSRGTTALIIAHRLSTVVHADEIVVLSRGTVAERGNHCKLIQRAGLYAKMWHAQHAVNPTKPGGTSNA